MQEYSAMVWYMVTCSSCPEKKTLTPTAIFSHYIKGYIVTQSCKKAATTKDPRFIKIVQGDTFHPQKFVNYSKPNIAIEQPK